MTVVGINRGVVLLDQYPNLLGENVPKPSITFPIGWKSIVDHLFSRLNEMLADREEMFTVLQLEISFGRLQVVWKLHPWIPIERQVTQSDLLYTQILPAELSCISDRVAHEINCAEFASWSRCQDCGGEKAIWLSFYFSQEMAFCDSCRVANGYAMEILVEPAPSYAGSLRKKFDQLCEAQERMKKRMRGDSASELSGQNSNISTKNRQK